MRVFIGYDKREHLAAMICKYSIVKRSPESTHITFLKSIEIDAFKRERERTQSTDFTYTRFLVPYLSGYQGWSVFCDCDFLFLNDINLLMAYADPSKAVCVVKHPSYIPHTGLKMDNIPQHRMEKKNWASLMLFNNSHPDTQKLTPEYINTVQPGVLLHTFDWTDNIGSIPMNWNVLDNYYDITPLNAIHYTDGGPWFENYKQTQYSNYWWREYHRYSNDPDYI